MHVFKGKNHSGGGNDKREAKDFRVLQKPIYNL